VPTDPIVRARAEALEADGKSSFAELHVPAATIVLKQGFGRLVRTRRDAGIVALLDERVHRRGYGKTLLAALPPASRADDLGAVRTFWQAHEGTSNAPAPLLESDDAKLVDPSLADVPF
jgi:ATP-dependent DNA helicase DinG